jgi:hypothetical protein
MNDLLRRKTTMPVDEISARLRARLQEEYGVDEAAILMDRPPGGWGDLVTNQSLDQRLATLEVKFEARFEAFEHKLMGAMDRGFRDQTWRLMTATIGAMSALVAAMAIFVAIFNSR